MKQTFRNIFVLGLPLLLGNLSQYFHQVADSAMLGQYGQAGNELAAMGIAGLFTWVLNTLLWPLSVGIQALASRRYGTQDHGELASKAHTGEVVDNGLVVMLGAVVLAMGLSFTARPILSALVENVEVRNHALAYIGAMRWSFLPMGIFIILQGFLGAIHQTRWVMIASLASNAVNIFLNWVFIFGNLGMPTMGIRGAALGTVMAGVASALILIVVVLVKGWHRDYHFFAFFSTRTHMSRSLQGDILKVALPPCIQNMVALSIFMVYETMIEDYSAIWLAATHAAFSWFRLNKTLIGGFSRAAAITAGNFLGRGDREGARRAITVSGAVGLSFALLVGVLTFFGHGFVARVFSSDPGVAQAISTALLFFWPFFLIEALGYSFEIVFAGNGYGRYVLASEASTNIIFILGASFIARWLAADTVQWAWFTFGLYQLAHASIMIIGWVQNKWTRVKVDSKT